MATDPPKAQDTPTGPVSTSLVIQTLGQLDRFVRAGANYALVLIGLTVFLLLFVVEASDSDRLTDADLIGLGAVALILAGLGAVLQARTESVIKTTIREAQQDSLNAATKRMELTQRFYLAQLEKYTALKEEERESASRAAAAALDSISKSSGWPTEQQDPGEPPPPASELGASS